MATHFQNIHNYTTPPNTELEQIENTVTNIINQEMTKNQEYNTNMFTNPK